MSKFICEKCQTYPCILDSGDGSTSPFYCPFSGLERSGWIEMIEEKEPQKPPIYYTLPAPTAETEIDYKKAFDLILEHYGHGGSKFSCKLCKALGIHCLSSGECNDKIIEAIKRKCTKGGE